MSSELDRLLGALRSRIADAPLDQLEPRVWGRIDAQRRGESVGVWGWRAGLAAVALAVGAVVSGASTATARSDTSPFEIRAIYTPSTLLGGR
jgi:hypothetical protein